MTINDELIAGDTLDFFDTVAEYPPSAGWTLKYRLIPSFTSPTQAPITLTATSSGDTYRVQEAASVTALWVPGSYTWARWVEKAGPIRQSLGDGLVQVIENPATAAAGYDSRSYERKMLDQVQAALLALSTGAVKSYAIGGRQMTYHDLPELIEQESRLKWLVANEDARELYRATGVNARKVGIRFVRI